MVPLAPVSLLVLGLEQRLEAVVAGRAGHVGERLGVAEREARPLDEGAGRVDRDRALVLVVDVHRHVGAQRAIGGLRAAVEVEVRAMPRRVRAHRAILRARSTRVVRRARAGDVPAVVGSDIAADLEADVAARDVVEALAVEGADLHVFDRLGLDGKIGCLRPRNCDESCRGAEEKTFHHLHSNLQVALHGRVPSPPGAPHPMEGPLQSPRPFRSRIKTPSPEPKHGDLGMPPSVATSP